MKKFYCVVILLTGIVFGQVSGQSHNPKNYLYLQANYHMEKRGTTNYYTSNPDFALGYERKIVTFGRNNILLGARAGVYREYVLTGYGWDHPTRTRPFAGFTPSYRVDVSRRIRFEFNVLAEILIPDDYDEVWPYLAFEPSFNFYFTDYLYAGLSGTMGAFFMFDPTAYMDKAGIKIGYAFGR